MLRIIKHWWDTLNKEEINSEIHFGHGSEDSMFLMGQLSSGSSIFPIPHAAGILSKWKENCKTEWKNEHHEINKIARF